MIVAHNIEKLRLKLGLNLHDFGKLLEVSAMAISRWERGDNVPSEKLIRLALLAHHSGTSPWPFLNAVGLSRARIEGLLAKRTRSRAL